jgi:diamine N-acetyltransferase
MYFFVYSWEGKATHMEDLYVTEAYRGKGIGTKVQYISIPIKTK